MLQIATERDIERLPQVALLQEAEICWRVWRSSRASLRRRAARTWCARCSLS